jgi:16S rRNA (cytosine967-C5)-methyltransferase
MMNAREAAYLALLASIRQEDFITSHLETWMKKDNPSKLDVAFAYEIASGSARMALALDYLAAQMSTAKKLSLKLKERALVRTAVYQYYFMAKVPVYAIVNETIELAKKYCHKTFVAYLNALLRRLEETKLELPAGNDASDLSIRYSYSLYFVEELIQEYGKEQAEEILSVQNMAPKTMVRLRPGFDLSSDVTQYLEIQTQSGLPVAILDKAAPLAEFGQHPGLYIQNITPVALITMLAEHSLFSKEKMNILDLCASPGGKLLAAYDRFPHAQLFANDVSEEKLVRLSQNLRKYGIEADLKCGLGEDYVSQEKFDLIILDVPCSNSGVLNKRPEARWRLSKDSLKELEEIQLRLIQHALTLLSPDGVIWYLTCSILKKENEGLVQRVKHLGLEIAFSKVIVPNREGWDGGFGAVLRKI